MYNSNRIKAIKEKYPPGTRIKLIEMYDDYAPVESGTEGTVNFVDDAGQIHMTWDNGRTLALVPEYDKFNIIPSMQTFKLYMPLTVNEYTQHENGDWDEYPLKLNESTILSHYDKILTAILNQSMPEEKERGLMIYYDEDNGLKEKIHSLFFTVEKIGDRLMGVAECQIKRELNLNEIMLLKNWVTGQAADGVGESFEQHPIKIEDGEIYVSLWNYDDGWNVLTKEELECQNSQEHYQINEIRM